jgi:hypothetical protein
MQGIRALVFDAVRAKGLLDETWWIGALFARMFGRFDVVVPAYDWPSALRATALIEQPDPIAELHFWGHGSPGRVYVGGKAINRAVFTSPTHPWHAPMVALSSRLRPESLVWWRTCSTFARAAGHAFAREAVDFFGCRVAASTFNIGLFHSGIHSLRPGDAPSWSVDEGVTTKKGRTAQRASAPWCPHTISCFRSRFPRGW